MRALVLVAFFLLLRGSSFGQLNTVPHATPKTIPNQPGLTGDAVASPNAAVTKTVSWISNLDLGKLVGAATAPVNLIIAASIAISFQIAKQGAVSEKYRLVLDQYKQTSDDHSTSHKLFHQLRIFTRRLRIINWSCRAMAITIVLFIGTVVLTSFGVTFLEIAWAKIATGLSLLAGLLSMLVGFVMELMDNSLEADFIDLEMREEQSIKHAPR